MVGVYSVKAASATNRIRLEATKAFANLTEGAKQSAAVFRDTATDYVGRGGA